MTEIVLKFRKHGKLMQSGYRSAESFRDLSMKDKSIFKRLPTPHFSLYRDLIKKNHLQCITNRRTFTTTTTTTLSFLLLGSPPFLSTSTTEVGEDPKRFTLEGYTHFEHGFTLLRPCLYVKSLGIEWFKTSEQKYLPKSKNSRGPSTREVYYSEDEFENSLCALDPDVQDDPCELKGELSDRMMQGSRSLN
ncbi:hypothetical protein QJS10_CPA09g00973 [Acorus calamus]|uniref:Uncharacterized protein n=1 Tax=Acorus calamus TaxID=4465 RepID=A0AAV9E5F2_ACOCL|nr:hypothetical protein QJS10_CPA09g00973 [Acorus calamus]